jgi:putative ABC transport system permease protein
MWHVTFKSLLSRKIRLFTTSLAIAVGVAFVTGALILGATINKTFDDLFSNVYKNTSAVVRGQSIFSVERNSVRAPIDQNLVQTVKGVPGVLDAQPSYQGNAQLVGKNGNVIGGHGAPTFGDVWDPNSKLNPFQIVDGKAPTQDNEVVIDRASAKSGKFNVGDSVTILTTQAPEKFVISGIAKFGQVDSPGGASYALFDNATAQRLVGQPGKVSTIAVLGELSVSQQELVTRIQSVMPSTIDVITGKAAIAESQADLKKDISFVTLFLEIFGFITLFVGAFIINNTFSILLAQRLKETALLRAVGATRRQVMNSMVLESVFLGLIASVVGVGLGILFSIGIKAVLAFFNISIASGSVTIPASAPITALIAGVGITVVSSVFPAIRSSKIPPLAALRDIAIDTTGRSVRRFAAGVVIAIAGAVLFAIGLITSISKPYIPTGAGAALIFIGVAVMGPAIARPASWLIGWPLPKLLGTTGQLARENALRNPRRTSGTASALMIGVALVTLASVLFTSVKVSTDKAIDRDFSGDFIVSGGGGRGPDSGFSPALAAQLRTKKQLTDIAEERDAPALVDGSRVNMSAIDTKNFVKVINLHVTQGNLENLKADQFGTTQKMIDAQHWALGQQIKVQFEQGPVQTLTLGAIYQDDAGLGDYSVPLAAYESTGIPQTDSSVFINRAPGVSAADGRAAVLSVTDQYPGTQVQDEAQFKETISNDVNRGLNIFYGLLGLAILIALIGIANTLALSVLERTREIGLMRAVGMTRRQVRALVRWESVIVALLGTFLGLVIGVSFGWALVTTLHGNGVDTLSFPIVTMVWIGVIAAAAGVLAAILPARRASRINILRAIATE